MSDSERVKREAEERRVEREKQMVSYSPEVRKLHDEYEALREGWQDEAKAEIMLKTAIGGLEAVRRRLETGTELATEIDSLVPKLRDQYGVTYTKGRRLQAESRTAYDAFVRAQREERVSRLKPENQDRGRDLLDEMDQKLAEVKQPIDAGRFGGAGGTVFGLEMRREHAEKAGNAEEVAHIDTSLERARKEMHEAEELMNGYRATIASIRASCEEQLRQLE